MHLHPISRWLGGLIACAGLALPASASALSPGDLVVADADARALTVVNPTSGVRTNLSSNAAPAGAPRS
jgi:hypothetical protein